MLIETIKENRAALFCALMVMLIFGFPHAINIYHNGYDLYNPLPYVNGLIENADEIVAAPGINRALEGKLIVNNPQIIEHKDYPSHADILPYLLLGLFGIFGFTTKDVFILSDFIFPAVGFIVLYFLMKNVFKIGKNLSILFSLLVILYNSFTDFLISIFKLNVLNFFSAQDMFAHSRLYAPELIFIPFLLAIISLFYVMNSKKQIYSILTIILGVSLVYSYIFYSSTFWLAFLILFAYKILYEKEDQKNNIKKFILISVPSFLLSIPYIINLLALKNLPSYNDILLRTGAEFGRFIHIPLIYALTSGIFLIILYISVHNKNRFNFIFITSFVASATILSNIQIITGFNIQPFHWTLRVIELFYFIGAAYLLNCFDFTSTNKILNSIGKNAISFFNIIKKISAILIIIFILYGFGYSSTATYRNIDLYNFSESELQLYGWLNNNTQKSSVVMTDSIDQSMKISSYTHNNIYLPNGFITDITTEEITDRLVFTGIVYNISENSFYDRINHTNDALRLEYIDNLYKGKKSDLMSFEKYMLIHYLFHLQFFYGHWYYQQQNPDNPGSMGYYFPEEFRNSVMTKFRNHDFTIYQYDYVLLGPYEKSIGISKLDYKEAYINKDFILYKVKNA